MGAVVAPLVLVVSVAVLCGTFAPPPEPERDNYRPHP